MTYLEIGLLVVIAVLTYLAVGAVCAKIDYRCRNWGHNEEPGTALWLLTWPLLLPVVVGVICLVRAFDRVHAWVTK